ncbi:hypothetical protein HK102_004131 [Quaeritorhiza haematococci]|nr:hypothetical protein HK102_004131 [Quaeritorhiza haematococci]
MPVNDLVWQGDMADEKSDDSIENLNIARFRITNGMRKDYMHNASPPRHPLRSWRDRYSAHELGLHLSELLCKILEYGKQSSASITAAFNHDNGVRVNPWTVHTPVTYFDGTAAGMRDTNTLIDVWKGAYVPAEFFALSWAEIFDLLAGNDGEGEGAADDPQLWMVVFFRIAYATAKVTLHKPAMLALVLLGHAGTPSSAGGGVAGNPPSASAGLTLSQLESNMQLNAARTVAEEYAQEIAHVASLIARNSEPETPTSGPPPPPPLPMHLVFMISFAFFEAALTLLLTLTLAVREGQLEVVERARVELEAVRKVLGQVGRYWGLAGSLCRVLDALVLVGERGVEGVEGRDQQSGLVRMVWEEPTVCGFRIKTVVGWLVRLGQKQNQER